MTIGLRLRQEICAGKTLNELMGDWQATLALRALEILGEAVKRLPNDIAIHKWNGGPSGCGIGSSTGLY